MSGSFVILEHLGHGLRHFDFLLEAGQALACWRFAQNPAELQPGCSTLGTQLTDHRLEYLTYEGPISAGRGEVRRVQQGRYRCNKPGQDIWLLEITSQTMQGSFTLSRQYNSAQWTLTREKTP
ncbi:MAG: hypothetical protein DRP83_08965 [Planctomycetota bacterium]|nr:MAG: hypothetical protein DRP83_08965 [Planctomycetota bacterium]